MPNTVSLHFCLFCKRVGKIDHKMYTSLSESTVIYGLGFGLTPKADLGFSNLTFPYLKALLAQVEKANASLEKRKGLLPSSFQFFKVAFEEDVTYFILVFLDDELNVFTQG